MIAAPGAVIPRKSRTPKRVGRARPVITLETPPQRKGRAERYVAREGRASAPVKAKLVELRAEIQRKGRSFQVGYTSALDRPLSELTGLVVPADPLAGARAHNDAVVRRVGRRDLLQRAVQRHGRTIARKGRQDPAGVGDGLPTPKSPGQGGQGPSGNFAEVCSPSAYAYSWHPWLSPIRSQGSCGSCWSFSAVAAYEANQQIVNGLGIDVSEQHVLDCAKTSSGDAGSCKGGWPKHVFNWLSSGGAVQTEQQSPYKAVDQSCPAQAGSYKAASWGWVDPDVDMPSVAKLKSAICKYGPVSASVAVTPLFQGYKSGVFDEGYAGKTNHAIVLVGWDDARGAWLLRNSWDTDWGEGGYMWIKYGSNSVGKNATWVLVEENKPPPPPSQSVRYLMIRNSTGAPLDVSVQSSRVQNGKRVWSPAAPGGAGKATSVKLKVGEVKYAMFDKQSPVLADRVRVFARAGTTEWKTWWSRDLNVVPTGSYPGDWVEPFYLTFLPQAVDTAATADKRDSAYEAGRAASKAKRYAEAAARFETWSQQFAEDPRVGSAMYNAGVARLKTSAAWDAIDWLTRMQSKDPEHPWHMHASYWLGEAYAQVGWCGTALGYFESVAWTDEAIEAVWRDAANANISRLNADDGTVCESWG